MLSRTNLADSSRHSSLNPRPVNLLQPLLLRPKSQLLWNQANPASFCKIARVGYPERIYGTPGVGLTVQHVIHCTEAQKCPSVSPLFATLTHSMSRKSFACHSYANTRDGGVTPPPISASVLATPILFALCFYSDTNPFSRKSFLFTSIQILGGVTSADSVLRPRWPLC